MVASVCIRFQTNLGNSACIVAVFFFLCFFVLSLLVIHYKFLVYRQWVTCTTCIWAKMFQRMAVTLTLTVFCHYLFLPASVGFRTTPMDSTGVSHILEHTVLCGSQNYPVRDPFFKMLNRSLSTFMNAWTG